MIRIFKVFSLFTFVFLFASCANDKETNFILNGKIKGLKKGVVYLQKDGDSTIVDLDSLTINGASEFTLKTNIDEPILLYLKLFKNDGEEHYIPFFADKGTTELSTSLNKFNFDAKIKGSKQQDLLNAYLEIMEGYKNCSGDAAIVIDCDLQDPVEIISEFIIEWQKVMQ